MSRYIFLAFEQRGHDAPRTLGSLFFACSDELKDLSIAEAFTAITQPCHGEDSPEPERN